MQKNMIILVASLVIAVLMASFFSYLLFHGGTDEGTLILATTTSTHDSGLLEYILPEFEDKYDCNVSVIAFGSGAAMELGKNGDCDVLLVHSPAEEVAFINDGYGDHRTQVMYNSFVIVGPESDPVGTGVASNASHAFQMIYDNGMAGATKFISRADNSGTYTKELSIWATLGYNKTEVLAFDSSWYVQAQTGMGAVLDMCEEMGVYTLSDDATYYSRVAADLIPSLNMTYSGDPELFNQYNVIAVNSTLWPDVNRSLALDFIDWMTSDDGQELIASYEKYGHQLFFPNAPGYVPETSSLSTAIVALQRLDHRSALGRLQELSGDVSGP